MDELSAPDPTAPRRFHGRIAGAVSYREGDGAQMPIPEGPVEIVLTAQDATLAWQDGDVRGSATLPVADYGRHLATGAIVVEGGGTG